jgi:hypothetical protein
MQEQTPLATRAFYILSLAFSFLTLCSSLPGPLLAILIPCSLSWEAFLLLESAKVMGESLTSEKYTSFGIRHHWITVPVPYVSCVTRIKPAPLSFSLTCKMETIIFTSRCHFSGAAMTVCHNCSNLSWHLFVSQFHESKVQVQRGSVGSLSKIT